MRENCTSGIVPGAPGNRRPYGGDLIGEPVASPSVATIKRLFAVSQNRCAFPKCAQPLVEPTSGKVVGRVCHIKAASTAGPRYDPNQSEEERHGFANLILMCPVHHDVIDADPSAYTVERLRSLKQQHESAQLSSETLHDAQAQQFISSITNNTVESGSIIYSVNQAGGQIAHSITNVGPQPRELSASAANAVVLRLRALPPESYEVETVSGDAEASRLAHQLDNMLSHTGWVATTFATSIFPQHITGITLSFPRQTDAVQLLASFLMSAQLQPTLRLLPSLGRVHLLVGSQR
jgi:hypothetical protein